jgi:hypothetical protein
MDIRVNRGYISAASFVCFGGAWVAAVLAGWLVGAPLDPLAGAWTPPRLGLAARLLIIALLMMLPRPPPMAFN